MDDGSHGDAAFLVHGVPINGVLHDYPSAVHVLVGHEARQHPTAYFWPSIPEAGIFEGLPFGHSQRLNWVHGYGRWRVEHRLAKLVHRVAARVLHHNSLDAREVGRPNQLYVTAYRTVFAPASGEPLSQAGVPRKDSGTRRVHLHRRVRSAGADCAQQGHEIFFIAEKPLLHGWQTSIWGRCSGCGSTNRLLVGAWSRLYGRPANGLLQWMHQALFRLSEKSSIWRMNPRRVTS